jgi:hypothetical protein
VCERTSGWPTPEDGRGAVGGRNGRSSDATVRRCSRPYGWLVRSFLRRLAGPRVPAIFLVAAAMVAIAGWALAWSASRDEQTLTAPTGYSVAAVEWGSEVPSTDEGWYCETAIDAYEPDPYRECLVRDAALNADSAPPVINPTASETWFTQSGPVLAAIMTAIAALLTALGTLGLRFRKVSHRSGPTSAASGGREVRY